jgi:hypothetical protein
VRKQNHLRPKPVRILGSVHWNPLVGGVLLSRSLLLVGTPSIILVGTFSSNFAPSGKLLWAVANQYYSIIANVGSQLRISFESVNTELRFLLQRSCVMLTVDHEMLHPVRGRAVVVPKANNSSLSMKGPPRAVERKARMNSIRLIDYVVVEKRCSATLKYNGAGDARLPALLRRQVPLSRDDARTFNLFSTRFVTHLMTHGS